MTDSAAWKDLWRGGLFAQFSLLVLGVWLNAADTLVTVTVMPSVAKQIGGYAYFGWATAVFLLGAITAGASAGVAARRLGLRSAMVWAGMLYSVGCGLDALSPHIGPFLIGRLVQGIGAGWIIGLVFVAVGAVFPERLWARVFAAITGVWGVATLFGPMVGGAFAGAGPGAWRGAFWLFAGQGAVFCLAAGRLLPPKVPDGEIHPLPWRQLLVLAAGVLAIASAGLAKGPIPALVLTLTGLALLILMIRMDANAPAAMLPRQTRNLGSAAGAGYLTIFLLQAGTIGWSVYGAVFVQAIYGANPLVSGYVVSCEALGWTLAGLPVTGLGSRWHGLFIRLGAGCVVLGVIAIAVATGKAPLWAVAAASALIGIGFGLAWSFLSRRILASLPDEERSQGSSAIPTVQMIGSAAGAAGAGALADVLGLAAGVDRAGALRAAPFLFLAFLPLAVGGWFTAHRLARLAPLIDP
jgi:MFS family permease